MENYNQNISGSESVQEDAGGVSLRELWFTVINHWKWFVLSLCVFLFVGVIYYLRITPTYSRSAQVLIKEDNRKSNSIMDVSTSFSDLGFGMGRVNVDNEMYSFQSPDLLLEVVRNLKLDVSYRTEGFFHDRPLYGSSLPIEVEFLTVGYNEPADLKVTPADSAHVTLSNFTLGKDIKDDKTLIKAAYGDTVATPSGNVVVRKASSINDLAFEKPVLVARRGYRSTVNSCQKKLSVALANKNSTVLALTYNDVNVQRADDVLWMIINVYNENWIKDKNLISISTNQFIAERLRIIEQELGSVDKNITSFRSTHRIPNEGAVSMDMQISKQSSQKIVDLNTQLSIARLLKADIMGAATGALLPANVGLNDANTESQINQYNNGAMQRKRLVENSSEDNLIVKDLDAQLASLKDAILVSLDTYIRSVGVQIESTQQVQVQSEARVSDMPLQTGALLSDERQQKVKESLYLYLLQKREENELSQAFTAYTTRIIASPGGSPNPVSPKRNMILLVAMFLGLALPFGWFYLKEVLNTTVRGRKDLENLSVPFLGELPSIAEYKHFKDKVLERLGLKKDPNADKREIVVKPHSRDIINEAFRVVRTNLEFMKGKDAGCTVIMVTSFNVGSGKTFISSNLSTALAVKHRRVLVIDLDLRRRSLSALVETPHKGITDYLSAKTDDYKSLIVKGAAGTALDILPVGMMPPNPAELLAEPRLAQMISELRAKYDYIFLDCPPIEIVTDADVVAPLADMTILSVRAGLLERAMLPQIDKYYASKRYNNICIVLNGTEGAGQYGYRYGYKYGYAYGKYGYGHGYGYYGSKHSGDTYYGSSDEELEKQA